MDIDNPHVISPEDRHTDTRPWNQQDQHSRNNSDTMSKIHNRLSTPLSLELFSRKNITRIQQALRKAIIMKTQNKNKKGIDIGIQPMSGISNELSKFYYDLKYSRMEIPPDQIPVLVRDISFGCIRECLIPNVMNNIESRELYNSWALKVPEPIGYGHNEKVVDKSVDLHGYYDESLGGFYSNDWNWSQSAMYDEPASLYKRYK